LFVTDFFICGYAHREDLWTFRPFVSSPLDVLPQRRFAPLVLGFQLNKQKTLNTPRGETSRGRNVQGANFQLPVTTDHCEALAYQKSL